MSAENYIVSAARTLAEIAKQMLASHGVDVDDFFDVEVNADAGSTEDEGGGEAAGESADAIFDVTVEEPEKAIKKMTDEGMASGVAREEYAGYLSEQIGNMQRDIIEYEMQNHPNAVLEGKLRELSRQLSDLGEDISGGATDMDALKGYYNRLDTIKKDGMKLA